MAANANLARILQLLGNTDDKTTDNQARAQSVMSQLQSVQEKEESLRQAYSGLWKTISNLEREQQERQALIDQVKSLVPPHATPSRASIVTSEVISSSTVSHIAQKKGVSIKIEQPGHGMETFKKPQTPKEGTKADNSSNKTQDKVNTVSGTKQDHQLKAMNSTRIEPKVNSLLQRESTKTQTTPKSRPLQMPGDQATLGSTGGSMSCLNQPRQAVQPAHPQPTWSHQQLKKPVSTSTACRNNQKMFISPQLRIHRPTLSRERGSQDKTAEKKHPREGTPINQTSPRGLAGQTEGVSTPSGQLELRLSPKDPARHKVDQIFNRILKNKVDNFDKTSVVSGGQDAGGARSRSPSLNKSQLKWSRQDSFIQDSRKQSLAKTQSFLVIENTNDCKENKPVLKSIYSPQRVILGEGSSQRSIVIQQSTTSDLIQSILTPTLGRASSSSSHLRNQRHNREIEVIDATEDTANIYASIPRININLSADKREVHKIQIETDKPHLVRVRVESDAHDVLASSQDGEPIKVAKQLILDAKHTGKPRPMLNSNSSSGLTIGGSNPPHGGDYNSSFDTVGRGMQSARSGVALLGDLDSGRTHVLCNAQDLLQRGHFLSHFTKKHPSTQPANRFPQPGKKPEQHEEKKPDNKIEEAKPKCSAPTFQVKPKSETPSKDPLSVHLQKVNISASKEIQTPQVPQLKVSKIEELFSPAVRTASFQSLGVGSTNQSHTHESLLAIEAIWNKNRCSREDFTSSRSFTGLPEKQKLNEFQIAQVQAMCSARTAGGKENMLQRDPSFGRLSSVTTKKDGLHDEGPDPLQSSNLGGLSIATKNLSAVSQMSAALPWPQPGQKVTPLLNISGKYTNRDRSKEQRHLGTAQGLSSQRTLLKGNAIDIDMIEEASEIGGLSAKSSTNSTRNDKGPLQFSSPAKKLFTGPRQDSNEKKPHENDDLDQIEAFQKAINSKFENIQYQLSGMKNPQGEEA